MLTTRIFANLIYKTPDLALLDAPKDIKDDSTHALEKALKLGANINVTDIRIEGEFNYIGYQYTPLLWAIHNGQINKVKYLLSKGANPHLTTARGNTILHIAARQGLVDLYFNLAKSYPELRNAKGENNLTPGEVAKKYARENVSVVNEKYYTNPYFPNIKTALPDEIILKIIDQIPDIQVSNSLKYASTTWYKFFQDKTLKDYNEKKLRDCLPVELQKADWVAIYNHYYPAIPLPKDISPYLAFVQQIHRAYVIGHPFQTYYEKSNFRKFMNDLSYMVDIWNRGSHWDVKRFTLKDAKASFDQLIKQPQQLTVYRNFDQAASDEFAQIPRFPSESVMRSYRNIHKHSYVIKPGDENEWMDVTSRSPIFEIKIDTDTALALLKNSAGRVKVSSKVITACDKFLFSDFIYKARLDLSAQDEMNLKPKK